MLLQPEFHERVWGGRRLSEVLGADLPDGNIGESWSMSTDSPVGNGPLEGRTLGELAALEPDAMLGSKATAGIDAERRTHLPLLFKILDAQDLLSIQVHPDDLYARERESVPFGKTEAWYCLDATPGAYVIHGFTRAVTPEEIRSGIESGGLAEVLRKVEMRPGDALLVPAGTVHAIGGGLLLGEIQENSDVTYRLYDWGRPREMHVRQGLEVLDPGPPGFSVSSPLSIQQKGGTVRYLLACRYFLYEELTVTGRLGLCTGGSGSQSFHCLFCVKGGGLLRYRDGSGEASILLSQGQTIFVPAALGEYSIEGEGCKLLRASVPDLREDVITPLLEAGHSPSAIAALGGPPGNELEHMVAQQEPTGRS